MKRSKFIAAFISVVMTIASLMVQMPVSAASVDYPAQLVRISTSDNSRNINISGSGSGSALNTWTTNGNQNENWRFDYKNGLFKIVNQGTGMVLTPEGGSPKNGAKCVISPDSEKNYQYWVVTAVANDSLGNGLHYKITNFENQSLALTYNSSANTITLSSYSGSSNQKFLLNSAGLTGFGGYVKDMSGKAKASTIGGLLGETVYVDTFDELQKACGDSTPRTIVITSNISKKGSYTKDGNGRYNYVDARIYIYPNKTIIGSYSAISLYNVYFRTYRDSWGQGRNIIIRNIDISHDKELNHDNVWEFSYGWNFWIDHCTFTGHSAVNTASTGLVDWDKFLCFSGTTDYATVSDCKFGLHEYGLLMGYPSDTQADYNTYNGKPCVTLTNNYFKDTITRAPGLMRYGYFHSFNNYVYNFDMGYTNYTASRLYAEGNYYDGASRKGSVVNDKPSTSDISYKYPAQYTEVNSTLVNSNFSLKGSSAGACSWRPSSNYSYTAKSANEAKSYCTSYSGAQTSRSKVKYAAFASTGVPSASYITTGSSSSGSTGSSNSGSSSSSSAVSPSTTLAGLAEGVYMIKNANSGLCLDVTGGVAANGTNVQQWNGTAPGGSYNTWKLVDAGNGYYNIYSMVGDGNTYLLDVTAGKSTNGANIEIYKKSNTSAQLFKIVKNSDGTYSILTRTSGDKSAIDVSESSKSNGANILQWEYNGGKNQKWTFEKVSSSSSSSGSSSSSSSSSVSPSTTVAGLSDGVYMIKNVNSGLSLDVAGGAAANGTNVQQWAGTAPGASYNTWKLVNLGNGYYTIYSMVGGGNSYVLDVTGGKSTDGTNIEIYTNKSNNAQIFKIVKNSDGSYCILTKASGDKSAVEVSGKSKDNGANVIQYAYNGGSNQKWTFEAVEKIVNGGIYAIKNVNSGLYLDVAGAKAANGTNVLQYAYSNKSNQKWKLVKNSDGSYKIYSQVGNGSTYLLDLADGNTGSGTNIRIWQNTNSDAQSFILQENSDGSYAILTKATNGSSGLDVAGGSKDNSANVQQWGYSGGNHQKWVLEYVG